MEYVKPFECFWFIVMNVVSFFVFNNFFKYKAQHSKILFNVGVGFLVLWLVFRCLNYIAKISFIGTYVDNMFVLGCVIVIDFLFFTKLANSYQIVRFVKNIRVWYTTFNIIRISIFLLGLLTYAPFHIIVYPVDNLKKVDDYHLIGPYWGNKKHIFGFFDVFRVGNLGEKSVISVTKRFFIFRQVVFQRQYSFLSRYLGSEDHSHDIVRIGEDSLFDHAASYFMYRESSDYYITYLGDGQSYPWPWDGDPVLTPMGNEQYSEALIKNQYFSNFNHIELNNDSIRAFLDSSNRANSQPIGVQDHSLN